MVQNVMYVFTPSTLTKPKHQHTNMLSTFPGSPLALMKNRTHRGEGRAWEWGYQHAWAINMCFPFQPSLNITDGVDSSLTEYIFFYGTESPFPVSTDSAPQCTYSSCQHTFNDTSSQVQQYTVSVAARNVVGVGNASTPVSVGMWW